MTPVWRLLVVPYTGCANVLGRRPVHRWVVSALFVSLGTAR